MSGIDEQRLEDIPICPKCGERPSFWILGLEKTEDSWFWLYSDVYMGSYKEDTRLEKGGLNSLMHTFDLSDVDYVRCRPVDDYLDNKHNYYPESKEFTEVMLMARREEMNHERD